MKLLIALTLVFSLPPVVNHGPVFSQERKVADKVRAVKTIQGTFTNFEMGDYLHAKFRTPGGKELSLFVMKPGMEYFLVANKGRRLTLKYEVVDTYIPEAGDVMQIERLASAKAGNVTYESWWKATKAKYPGEAAHAKYRTLVEKYTKN